MVGGGGASCRAHATVEFTRVPGEAQAPPTRHLPPTSPTPLHVIPRPREESPSPIPKPTLLIATHTRLLHPPLVTNYQKCCWAAFLIIQIKQGGRVGLISIPGRSGGTSLPQYQPGGTHLRLGPCACLCSSLSIPVAVPLVGTLQATHAKTYMSPEPSLPPPSQY